MGHLCTGSFASLFQNQGGTNHGKLITNFGYVDTSKRNG
jgi:hypothetical protein